MINIFIELLHSQFQRTETKSSKFENLVSVVHVFLLLVLHLQYMTKFIVLTGLPSGPG